MKVCLIFLRRQNIHVKNSGSGVELEIEFNPVDNIYQISDLGYLHHLSKSQLPFL